MSKEKKEKATKGNSKKVIIIIVALVVVAASVFAGGYLAVANSSGEPKEVVIVEAYSELGEIFVNLNDGSSKRYVKLNATMSYDSKNKDLISEIEVKKVALRDTAIFYFKSLKDTDFNPDNEQNLKNNLVNKLNENLQHGEIISVKFSELLIQ